MSVKLALALAAVASLVQVAPADACEPAPNCGNTYCYSGATALVAGRITARQTAAFPPTITVEIASVHGDSGALAAGATVELPVIYDSLFEASDIGRSFQLLLRQGAGTDPEVVERIDPSAPFAVDCFGVDAPAATVADIVLSPTCFDTLEPGYEDPCADGCSVNRVPGSLPIVVTLALVALGARRPRPGRRTHRRDARAGRTRG